MPSDKKGPITELTGEFFEELVAGSPVGEKVRSCLQCGTCTASCPVAEFSDLSPREIVRLVLTGGREEVLRPEVLYFCSACYSCAVRCPMGVRLTELVNLLRDVMVSEGQGPLEAQADMVKSVENYDNPWQMPRAQRDRWSRRVKGKVKVLPKQKAEVLYYPGCTAAYLPNMQKVALATARVLGAAGVDFGIMGREEICCGSTAMRVGMKDVFLTQAGRNIEKLNSLGVSTIITACAGCFGIMKHEYPKVAPFDIEVLHASEALDSLIREGRLQPGPLERKVTYHDPCHLARHGGVVDAPRSVLASIPGIEVVEMARIGTNARCCGGGGGLRTGHTDTAVAIAGERQAEALETGAEALLTCCPFCEMNLTDAAAAGSGLPVIDLVELVAESLGLAEDTGAGGDESPAGGGPDSSD
ncbi:MAG TPA: (Fe-S)-binding protein [Candidatus Anoxymicrobiaceae bacterium]|jgi:heterodisulfide reductase subunit D